MFGTNPSMAGGPMVGGNVNGSGKPPQFAKAQKKDLNGAMNGMQQSKKVLS